MRNRRKLDMPRTCIPPEQCKTHMFAHPGDSLETTVSIRPKAMTPEVQRWYNQLTALVPENYAHSMLAVMLRGVPADRVVEEWRASVRESGGPALVRLSDRQAKALRTALRITFRHVESNVRRIRPALN